MLFLASDTFLRRPTAGPDLRRRDSTESAPTSALPRGGQHPPLRSTTARGRIAPPRRGCVRMRRRSRLVSAGAGGPGRVAMAAGGGGRRWRMVAPLLLVVFQLAGAASAAALPVVINTWAFRKAAETGAPAGGRAGPGGAGQGRAVPFCADRSVLPRCSLLQLRSRRGARGFGVTTK